MKEIFVMLGGTKVPQNSVNEALDMAEKHNATAYYMLGGCQMPLMEADRVAA